MYFDAAQSDVVGTLTIATGSSEDISRQWNIKVTYLGERDPMRAPSGCTRYFTGNIGNVRSYNYEGGVQIFGSRNVACFRQEAGESARSHSAT